MSDIRIEDYLGRKTLIIGDINVGKTYRTGEILADFCRSGYGRRSVVVDMAPEIPEKMAEERGLRGAGGKLAIPPGGDVLVFDASPEPPRLSSKTEAEALEKARRNRSVIDRLLREASRTSREAIFINDISLYLQAGDARDLIAYLDGYETVVANGYWGRRLGGGAVTSREKEEMTKLKDHMERSGRIVHLRFPR